MELVADYLFRRYVPQRDPLPFPQYLMPENMWNNAFWVTKEGECIYPQEMRTSHLLNTVRLINRTQKQLQALYDDCGAERYIEQGLSVCHQCQEKKDTVNRQNKKGKKTKGYAIHRDVILYHDLWMNYYLYMLLRREVKIRGLEMEL